MALSEISDSLCKAKTEELDLLGSNYYKLPFCDEDIKQFGENMDDTDDWVTSMLEDRFMNGTNELLAPSSPSSSSGALSPSSNSSASSSGNGNEHAYSLMTDRPDTPLTAVKIEDFSSDYPIGSLPTMVKNAYEPSFAFDSDFDFNHTAELDDLALSFDTEIASRKTQPENVPGPVTMSVTAQQHTIDKCLSSTLESLGSNVITISKMGDTVQVKKENDMSIDQSAFGSQKTSPLLSNSTFDATIIPSDCSNSATATTFRHPTKSNVINISANGKIENNGLPSPFYVTNMHDSTNSGGSCQAKVTRNSLTHRTQIQIPTSTLQTILKSGRLITKLRQDGQFLPRIKIKTEPCEGEQYVRICQPQIDVQLPPTPPSSNTSDNEGSSSPRGAAGTSATDITVPLNSSLQFMSSGSQISTQFLTSPQRLTQAHGELYLTEEEKRTLVSEGYAVPEKLPLTKGEEKALKKIRRKIKNKISAQESRRKKKEYVEALERRMESFNQENGDLRRKVDSLEDSNQTLLGQLRSLQMLVAEKMPKPPRNATTQTSSCLMVVVLCFAVFLGGWLPFLSPFMANDHQISYPHVQPLEVSRTWTSRVLLSYSEDTWESYGYCDVDGCYEDDPDFANDKASILYQDAYEQRPEHEVQEGSDTYDEPASGRVVMNDTKDQIGQVIANTMEPRDVAAVLASSRKVVHNGRKVQIAATGVMGQDGKKYAAQPSMVTE